MAKNVAKNGLSSFVFEGFSKIKFGLRQPFLVRKTFINGLKVRYNFNFISSHFLILLLLHGARRVTRSPVLQPERSFCATQIEMIYSDIFCTNFFFLPVADGPRFQQSVRFLVQLCPADHQRGGCQRRESPVRYPQPWWGEMSFGRGSWRLGRWCQWPLLAQHPRPGVGRHRPRWDRRADHGHILEWHHCQVRTHHN